MDTPRQTPEQSPLLPVLNALESNFSQSALKDIQPILQNSQTIEQRGTRVSLLRDKPAQVPMQGEFLNGYMKLTSLDIGNVSFNLDKKTQSASSIDGISLNVTFFGTPQSLSVEKLHIVKEANGEKILHTELANPLPEAARRITGMARTMVVQFPITADGLGPPVLSKVFSDAASSTGTSIAGLLTKDALTEASKVALFVESNPEWVNHVVQPVLHDLYRQLSHHGQRQELPGITMATPAAPAPNPFAQEVPLPAKEIAAPGNLATDVQKAVGDHLRTLTVDNVARTYRVHVPPSYNGKTPMPMVLLLHGHGQTGEEIARHTKMTDLADREGFIAIYPDARTWAGKEQWRAWDTDNGLVPPGSKADDVAFLRGLIETAEKDYVVDPKRIYMAGLSNGGMMTFRAAGPLSDKIAAIAVVSGAMSGTEPPPKHPISVLSIHGTNDGIVPYNGLKNVPASLTSVGLPKFKPMQYATDYWAEQNKITNPAMVLRNGDVTERRFMNTETGAEVNEYTILNGYHIPDNVDQLTGTIWNFFKSHPRATGPASETLQPPAEAPFDITERLKAHVETRGFKGLEVDVGRMLNEVHCLGNGSISPRNSLLQFEQKSGIELKDGISSFLKSTSDITKLNTRISITLHTPQSIPLGRGGAGPVGLKSIYVNSPSFDLTQENELPSLRDINGLTVNLNALGRDLSVDVREASQKLDGDGNPYYKLKADNPLPKWARIIMMADKHVPVELRLKDSGDASILNESQIKNATIGVNPVTRGYIDIGTHVHNFYDRPTVGSGLHLAKDLGVFGGTGYGAYRLAAKKCGGKGRVGAVIATGLIVAPAVIHGIERILE